MHDMGYYRPHRPSSASSLVVCLFVVAVLALAYFNEPLLISRVHQFSLDSVMSGSVTPQRKKHAFPFPDFNRYVHTQTLSPKDFGLDAHDERVIIVGDTHGMNHSLHKLLSTLHYDPHKDTLFLTGDMLAKSTEAGSLAILDFVSRQTSTGCVQSDASSNIGKHASCKPIYAVRGNHDQMVVQWRSWREWFEGLRLAFPSAHSYPRSPASLSPFSSQVQLATSAPYDAGPPVGTGSQFLDLIEAEWHHDRKKDPSGAGSDAQEWVDTARKRARGTWREQWWRRIPQPGKGHTSKDFIMFGDHYWIARDMKPEHAEFLYALPLVIHVPTEHVFLVHGGLLPSDPRHPSTDERQPLAHPPSPYEDDNDSDNDDDDDDGDSEDFQDDYDYPYPLLDVEPAQNFIPHEHFDDEIEVLRVVQERSVLQEVPQNRDAWAVLNMRGVRKGGKVTRRGDKGVPWAKVWNSEMRRCVGFENVTTLEEREDVERDGDADPLPCYPATVVYGHAASRDLDVRRWSVGIDTGCLYGRRLTALVLTRSGHEHEHAQGPSRTLPRDEDEDDEEEDDESLDEEEDLDDSEDAAEGPLGMSALHTRKRKTWTRKIRFGDYHANVAARLVSINCPKVADPS